MNSLRNDSIEIQYSTRNTNDDSVKGCPTLNPDCDVWDPIMCACLVCKPSYMDMEPHHETSNFINNVLNQIFDSFHDVSFYCNLFSFLLNYVY